MSHLITVDSAAVVGLASGNADSTTPQSETRCPSVHVGRHAPPYPTRRRTANAMSRRQELPYDLDQNLPGHPRDSEGPRPTPGERRWPSPRRK